MSCFGGGGEAFCEEQTSAELSSAQQGFGGDSRADPPSEMRSLPGALLPSTGEVRTEGVKRSTFRSTTLLDLQASGIELCFQRRLNALKPGTSIHN